MGLCESKPWQISLTDILEKIRCYSACCGGNVIIDEKDGEYEELIDFEQEETRVTWV